MCKEVEVKMMLLAVEKKNVKSWAILQGESRLLLATLAWAQLWQKLITNGIPLLSFFE